MPSGKASRQRRQATAPPPVRSKGSPKRGSGRSGQRQASPRVLIGAGIAVVVIAVGIGIAVALSGGSSSPPLKDVPAVGSIADGLPGSAAVESMFKGIPQAGTMLGDPSAPVTMEEFIDPQCPYCQEFETQVLPSLVKDYVRAGKLKIEMQPWAFIGPDSVTGQAAELAAAKQNRVFNFAEVLYDNQRTENTGWLNTSMIEAAAASVPGLKVKTLLSERSSSAVKAEQQTVDNLALARNITGTPTLFVGKTGTSGTEVQMSSATDGAAVVAAIKAAAQPTP
jgi:protein-disulfide isomerase